MTPPQPILILAEQVCPMDRPAFEGGGVAIVGPRIAALGQANELRRRFPGAKEIDYGSATLLPGLINCHTHLELTNHPRIEFDGDIIAWLLRQRPPVDIPPEQQQANVELATRAGIAQCLRFGVTCVADISQRPQWTRPILADSPMSCISFGEVLGLGKLRPRTAEMIERAIAREPRRDRLRSGLSPHAPYTLDLRTLRTCVMQAEENDLQLAMHLAEFSEETDFTVNQKGSFRDLWDSIDLWSNDVQTAGLPPIEMADGLGLLERRDLLIHVNYASDEDIQTLANGDASVVFCPRTHAYFQHPPHRWREMRAAGINVVIGTDSCASSPNLNIVDDLRQLHRQYRDVPCERLWQMVTTHAAKALNLSGQVGALSTAHSADLCVFPLRGESVLEDLLDRDDIEPSAVWVNGTEVGRNRAH